MSTTLPAIRDRFETMVVALIKKPEEILATVDLRKLALVHSTLGIAGEIGELQEPLELLRDNPEDETAKQNLLEEVGDFMFYVLDLRQVFGFIVRPDITLYTLPAGYNPVKEVGDVVDVVKRLFAYNAKMVLEAYNSTERKLARLELWLTHEVDSHGLSMERAMKEVLWKLREGPNARYPLGYSDQAAQDRADKQATETCSDSACGCAG